MTLPRCSVCELVVNARGEGELHICTTCMEDATISDRMIRGIEHD